MSKKACQRYEKVPGSSINKVMTELTDKKNALKCDEDTVIRTEIYSAIIRYIEQGKSQAEIISELSENVRYKKFNIYFENWTSDQLKKVTKKNERIK